MDENTKVDASTSTQDLGTRPLCLFYFSHPFAVLSRDPPTFAQAPADIAQTYINMEQLGTPFMSGRYHHENVNPKPSDNLEDTSKPSYEIGHNLARKPVRFQIQQEDICYDNIKEARHYNEHRCQKNSRRDAYSSTLLPRHGQCFAGEKFHCTRSTCCSDAHVRSWSRLPYNRNILPPLERPILKDSIIRFQKKTNDDLAHSKSSRRVSLPPISVYMKEDISLYNARKSDLIKCCNYAEYDDRESRKRRCGRSRNGYSRCLLYPRSSRGVRKGRRIPNKSGVRRLVTYLIQYIRRGRDRDTRSLLGLNQILHTIRKAWEEPKTLIDRSYSHTASSTHHEAPAMRRSGVPVDALAPRPGASPGLLCRRYSVPETIMRKYRLAQLRSADTEESETATAPSPLCRPASPASPSPSRSPSRGSGSSLHARRDRETMRKSALLRRLWSKNCGAAPYASSGEICCRPSRDCQACETMCGQCDLQNSYDSSTSYRAEPKSLDGSQNDIRQWDSMSGSWITRTLKNQAAYQTIKDTGCECCRKLSLQYPIARESRLPPSGYTQSSGVSPHSPKRQRLESPSGVSKSNEMLKVAMRNNYDKMEEINRQRECKQSSITERLTSTASSAFFSTSKTETSNCQSSQLSTFSYPATSSETSSNFTKTPTSHSSEDPPNVFRFSNRPSSVDSALENKSRDAASLSVQKRRQSICININALESPCAQVKPGSVTTTDKTESTLNSDRKFSVENKDLVISSAGTVPALNISSDSSKEEKETSSAVFSRKCNASTNTDGYATKVFETIPLVHEDIGNDNENIEGLSFTKRNLYTVQEGLKELSKNMKVLETTEMIEIVVSEMINSSALVETPTSQQLCENIETLKCNQKMVPKKSQKTKIDLDEYVSNILIESLNTLTDQIEGINASITGDRKVNILEKEIKVKLQNVELLPVSKVLPDKIKTEKTFVKVALPEPESEAANNNSNAKIDAARYTDADFSFESQLKSTYQESYCNNNFVVRDYPSLQLQINENSDERNKLKNTICRDSVENSELSFVLSSDKVNKAVLQQIQKLFKDGFNSLDSNLNYTHNQFDDSNLPEISHIEISNVDVFIENNSNGIDQEQKLHLLTDRVDNEVNQAMSENNNTDNLLSKMSTATYYKVPPEPILVPRFTAYPYTESMEVNTSSSDEGDMVGSDCMSLVDSLDDPNSPRGKLSLQQSRRRTELVRSTVDVLELLPDLSKNTSRESHLPKDKGESFFIRIKDNECDCEKENIVVADHMPDKIRQKLFRRHKKRELRMEYTKRKKIRQLKRELEKQKKVESLEAKKDIENDCVFTLSSLIDKVAEHAGDDIIKKPGHYCCIEEHKSTNISKKHPVKRVQKKTNGLHDLKSFKISKQGNVQFINKPSEKITCPQKFSTNDNERSIYGKDESCHFETHCKLPIQLHSTLSPEDLAPKRVYQKSEFRDGNKKVEILEILEYLETSPETSDDSVPKHLRRFKRSKIPVPIYEKIQRGPKLKCFQKPFKNNILLSSRYGVVNSPNTQSLEKHSNCKIDEFIANILIDALHDKNSGVNLVNASNDTMLADYTRLSSDKYVPIQRASVPTQELVNSGSRTTHTPRYKHTFASIPEEKGSISVESSNEDINLNRKPPLPSKGVNNNTSHDNNLQVKKYNVTKYVQTNGQTSPKTQSKNVSTSTNSPIFGQKEKGTGKSIGSPQRTNVKSATTSPMRQMVSASTSPISQVSSNGNHQNGFSYNNGKTSDHYYENIEKNKTANGKKSLSSHGTREGWVGFYNSKQKQAGHDEGKQNSYESDKEDKEPKPSYAENDITPSSHKTVRTMEGEKSKQITLNHEKETNVHVKTEERTEKKKNKTIKDPDDVKKIKNCKDFVKRKKDVGTKKSKNKSSPKKPDSAQRYSQSDPQLCTDYVITKTDTKKVEMISVQKSASEQSFDKSFKLPSFKGKPFKSHTSGDSTSDSESDSAKSLICSLAPKWLGNGSRQKRPTRKKTNSQEHNSGTQTVSGWSVTVAGNCYDTLPADVEMKLSFPKNGQTHHASQSDSGFGDGQGECKSRRNLALMQRAQVPSCLCVHCRTPRPTAECGHADIQRENSYISFLPPAQQNKRLTLTMKKESTGSSVHTAKSTKKQSETLPEVETYRSSKSKSKNSLKMARRFSLHCWLPEVDTESDAPHASTEDGLSVMGCAIVPELKPRVPTMSERDLTRIYNTQYYSRP